MYAAYLLRFASEILSTMMGGMAVFCLYYSVQVSDLHSAWWLFAHALLWGGAATAIVYCKNRYLD